jgi:hypothetical protein
MKNIGTPQKLLLLHKTKGFGLKLKNRANLMLLIALLYIYTCSMLLALTEGNQSIESFRGSPGVMTHKIHHAYI